LSCLHRKGAFDIEGIRMQYPVRYDESMNTVLLQECIRYNKLIAEMQRSLPELQKALKGLVVMSAELEAMGDAIAVNQVPLSRHIINIPSSPLVRHSLLSTVSGQSGTPHSSDAIPTPFFTVCLLTPLVSLCCTRCPRRGRPRRTRP
jgi:hypothetical protein